MRKYLKLCLLLSLFLAIFSLGFADTVSIGSGTGTSTYFPIYGLYGYNYTQQIVTQSQINTAGVIEKICFYYMAGVITNSKDWTIYMGHTDKTSFESNTDWVPLTELTQVYSGDVSSLIPAGNNWMEIPLATAFDYNNTDNLVIAVDENTPGYGSMTWGGYTSGTNTGIYYYSDGTNPDPANPPTATNRTAIISRLQLIFPTTSAPHTPTLVAPANNAVNQDSPVLSWQVLSGGDPDTYDLYLGTDPNPPLFAENLTQTSYQFSTHAYETDYYWKVVAKNGFGPSPASEIRKFTTRQNPIRPLPYSQDFNSGTTLSAIEWSGDMYIATNHGTDGSNGLYKNLYSYTTTTNVVSCPIGPMLPNSELKFDYRFVLYSSYPNNPKVLAAGDEILVQISTDNGATYTTIHTIDQNNHTTTNQFTTATVNLSAYSSGNAKFKLLTNWGSEDYYIDIDNFLVREIPANPIFEITPDTWNAGITIINTQASQQFTIRNSGVGTLNVTDISITGDYFALATPFMGANLGAEGSTQFTVNFNPLAGGDYQGTITIDTSIGIQYVDIEGSCFDPTIRTLPYTENFDSVTVPAMPLGWTVLNPDNTGILWKTYAYNSHSSPNSMFISYTSTGGGPLDDWAITPPVALEEGKEYRVSFYYRAYDSSCYENLALYFGYNPTATGMTELLWSDEDFNRTSYALVQETVSPTADGSYFFGWYAYSNEYEYGIHVDSIMIEELSPTPVFAVEPISHDFGGVQINTTSNKSIKVSNIGGGQLGITAIEISDTDAFELETLPTFPVILERNEFFHFNVVFAPTAAGTHNATITITDDQSNRYSVDAGSLRSKNSRSRDDHTVALTGSCFDPTIRTFPFFEGFEDGNTHDQAVAVRWTQLTGPEYTAKKWTANNTLTTYNRTPKSGTWNAFLQWSGESTLVRPIMLEANKEYKLKFYARQDGAVADNAKVKASFGTGNTLADLTETIIAQTGVINGDYQEFSGVFSTETSGLYYIGIHGLINSTPYYLSLDDISIDYNYVAVPNIPADIDANTSVTIVGDGFVGAVETTVAPEDLTPIPNANFIALEHQVWQLIGTGTVTLTFHNNDTEDIWIAYVVGGVWVAHEIPAGGSVDIMIDLDAKDANFEFALGKGGNPTLPVELSYFNAVFMINENSVKLSWKTESETQMLGYQIYRSMDRELANAIMITPSIINASNNSTGDSYSYLDSEVENGTYYYWLEAVSYNSSEYYGYQTVVIDIPSTPELPTVSSMSNAYPNPFKDITNVDIAIKGGETGSFTIYNMLGQVVYKQKLNEGNVKIEWHGRDNHGNRCSSGVYFYKLVTPTKSETKKMVIMK